MKIRLASAADLAAIGSLEELCFSSPWTASSLLSTFQTGMALFLVGENDAGLLTGYGIFSRAPGEWEVLRLGVSPAERRSGTGTRILEKAASLFAESGGGRLLLEVRASNLPALGLYRKAGFSPFSTRPRYYKDPVEDAVCMKKTIGPSGAGEKDRP